MATRRPAVASPRAAAVSLLPALPWCGLSGTHASRSTGKSAALEVRGAKLLGIGTFIAKGLPFGA